MYNTKLNCTYNNYYLFLKDDNISEDEKKEVSNVIYRQELLQVFGIDEYSEVELNNGIHDLYDKIKDCAELKECMTKLAGHFMSEDLELGLMILYAYDYMYLSHICICEYLETGKISEKNMWNLKSIIF